MRPISPVLSLSVSPDAVRTLIEASSLSDTTLPAIVRPSMSCASICRPIIQQTWRISERNRELWMSGICTNASRRVRSEATRRAAIMSISSAVGGSGATCIRSDVDSGVGKRSAGTDRLTPTLKITATSPCRSGGEATWVNVLPSLSPWQ